MTTRKKPDSELMGQFKQLLDAIEASSHAILPRSNDDLLQSIVDAAGRIFHAAAASILLVNEQERHLEFKVAYGESNQGLIGRTFPLDEGIAGYVVMTGQPLAVSNVRQDVRFNQDFAKSTGYVPNSLLAMPLLSGERILGVMEVLDKIDASSFGMQDMELLGLFARQAAIAIEQSQGLSSIQTSLISGLKKMVEEKPGAGSIELLEALDTLNGNNSNSDALAMADLFQRISQLGEREKKVCLDILKSFAVYQQSSPRTWHG
jgi:GAF domain-containing protein